MKSAIQKRIVHAPHHELARSELEFLIRNGERVDHPTTGPVQTKDMFDAMAAVVSTLLNGKYQALFEALGSLRPSGSRPSGLVVPRTVAEPTPHDELSGWHRRTGPPYIPHNPARQVRRERRDWR